MSAPTEVRARHRPRDRGTEGVAIGHDVQRSLVVRPGVVIEADETGLTFVSDARRTTLRMPAPISARLATALNSVQGLAISPDGSTAARLAPVLNQIGHLLRDEWRIDGSRVMARESTVRAWDLSATPLSPDDQLRLSRFALLRRREDDLILESPLAMHRFVLRDPQLLTWVAALSAVTHVRDLTSVEHPQNALAVLGAWSAAGLVERSDPNGHFESDRDPTLRQWDFHDLLMHARTRSGRSDEPSGALSPYRGRIEPLPAVVPPRADASARITLPRPQDPTRSRLGLGQALEERRSIRDYDERPVTVAELGEFLFRSFRSRARFDPPQEGLESKISRPYPSGGGLYEHELYVTVLRIDGLDPALYRYDSADHSLELINSDEGARQQMAAVSAAATGVGSTPDALITLTARFARMSWRYRSIAYANILRSTGAIYQTMYLVATDLDLAPCALGNGDADLSARVFGLDYLQESSVGDFILGRRRQDDSVLGPPIQGWSVLNTEGTD
ncbi:SagB/ThcOx family dehydrogenase [Dermacoccaceae bacterium W4C1]